MSDLHVYLAGSMTGPRELVFRAFESAARTLRAMGYVVYSPHESDDLALDVEAVLRADAVVYLPGSESVMGVLLAEALGKPTFPLESLAAA